MTRSVESWHSDDHDTKIPDRVKVRIFLRADGHCQKCTRWIGPKDRWECDHIIALVNGGAHDERNMQVLCIGCHKGKTRVDVALKAKSYRIRKRNAGIRKAKWKPMPGTRASGIRKRMNGSIERWCD